MSNFVHEQSVGTADNLAVRFASALLSALRSPLQSFVRYRERQRALASLSRLSDYELRDLGLTRGDLEWAVDHGRRSGDAIV